MIETRRVTISVAGQDGTPVLIDTAGLVLPGTPGLLITAWHVGGVPHPRRFTLTHGEGRALVALAWCPHLVRRWASQAGWIGVDWRAPASDLTASGVARLFAWRLFDEWRPHCSACAPVEVVDAKFAALVELARRTEVDRTPATP